MDNDFRNTENENEEMKKTEDQSYELEKVFEEGKENQKALPEENKEDQEGLGQEIQKGEEDLGQEIQEDQEEISQEDQEVQTQDTQVREAQQESDQKEDKESPQSISIMLEGASDNKKGGRGGHLAIIVLLSAILAALLVVTALLIPIYVNGWVGSFGLGADNGGITVVKNDGSIKVDEGTGSTELLTVPQIVEKVSNTVVEIRTKHTSSGIWFGTYETTGAGSGVIISDNGYIITNSHVVDGATEIAVRLSDGKTYLAELIGSDASVDIAVVKINETGLNFARMGNSADLAVGQSVIAIGNPLGTLGGTVTSGIISAKDREVIIDRYRMTLLQTNAAINPGNSGGGLFDMAGQLIGIVNAKKIDEQIEGLGFAIPIDIAWSAAEKIISN